jgi:hypothetical protein
MFHQWQCEHGVEAEAGMVELQNKEKQKIIYWGWLSELSGLGTFFTGVRCRRSHYVSGMYDAGCDFEVIHEDTRRTTLIEV